MDEKSVHKLKNHFVLIASISFFAVMLFMAVCIYFVSLQITTAEVHEVLDYIVENNGDLPKTDSENNYDLSEKAGLSAPSEAPSSSDSSSAAPSASSFAGSSDSSSAASSSAGTDGEQKEETPSLIVRRYLEEFFDFQTYTGSPEFYYSTRFFSVAFSSNGEPTEVKTGHIAAADHDEAVEFAEYILSKSRNFGRSGDYYYEKKVRDDGSTIVVVLDCTDRVVLVNRLLRTAMILVGAGIIITYFVMRAFSSRAVRTKARNIENQKVFITNASHELKTPLAVIKANTEILEMTNGENEWTQSTLRQVDRMNGLIANLVMITRAQEHDAQAARQETDVSKAVSETVDTFKSVAEQEGKKLETDIAEDERMIAEEGQIRQLTSLLVDNAIKYCDKGGTIRVGMIRRRGGIRLYVTNDYAEGKNVDYSRFFERFYREDKSHNQDKGGYGIGLSIAQNICEQYNGSIKASVS